MKWIKEKFRAVILALDKSVIENLAKSLVEQAAKGNAGAMRLLTEIINEEKDEHEPLSLDERVARVHRLLERGRSKRARHIGPR